MKKAVTLLVLLVLVTTAAWAQDRRSALQVRLTNSKPIVVAIDGRHFKRFGNTLTIGDLPPGRHELKVYRYFPANDPGYRSFGRTAHARLVYRGRFRVHPSKMYYCTVDPAYGSIDIRESGIVSLDAGEPGSPLENGSVFSDQQDSGNNAPAAGADEKGNTPGNQAAAPDYDHSAKGLQPRQMEQLRQNTIKHIADGDKLKLMKQTLEQKSLTTAQVVTMAGWLTFDDSRLDFAKWAYSRTIDQENYLRVNELLSFDSSRKEITDLVSAGSH